MAKIIINENKHTKGHLSAQTKTKSDGNLIIVGELFTHSYIENIYEIETDRYLFEDISITGFGVGSNDFFIKYDFECDINSMTFKGGESNLTEELIDVIEEKIFAHEKEELFHLTK